MHAQPPTVTCWACSVVIGVPFINNRPAEAFKCGWCGAINKLSQQPRLLQPCHCSPTAEHVAPCWQATSQHQPIWQQIWLSKSRAQPVKDVVLQCRQEAYQQCSKHQVPEQFCFIADSQHQLQQCQPAWPLQEQHLPQNEQLQQPEQLPQPHVLQQACQHPELLQLHMQQQQGLPQQQQQQPQQSYQQHYRQHTVSSTMQHSSRLTVFLKFCKQYVSQLLRWAIIAVVLAIVGSVAGTGVLVVLPRLCTTQLTYLPNLGIAAVLLANIVFHYAASVLQSPGDIADWVVLPPRGPKGEVMQNSYEHYTWCEWCRAPKPPMAHHCRTCKMCVVDMDHHCPFINNCVGRGNLRPFLLFLVWTMVAAAYILGMCTMLVYQQWGIVRSSLRDSSSSMRQYVVPMDLNDSSMHQLDHDLLSDGSTGSVVLEAAAPGTALAAETPAAGGGGFATSNWMLAMAGFAVVLIQYAPGWLLATYYLLAAATGLMLALGVLLWSQLSYMSRGVTYIGHLKGGNRGVPVQQQPQQHADGSAGWLDGQIGHSQQGDDSSTAPSRLRVLARRLRAVLGISSGDSWWCVFKVLLVPRWRDVAAGSGVPAVKKWS